jgi:hypothetical protein
MKPDDTRRGVRGRRIPTVIGVLLLSVACGKALPEVPASADLQGAPGSVEQLARRHLALANLRADETLACVQRTATQINDAEAQYKNVHQGVELPVVNVPGGTLAWVCDFAVSPVASGAKALPYARAVITGGLTMETASVHFVLYADPPPAIAS